MAQPWTHLIRFIAEEDGQIHLGNIDAKKYPDVGLSSLNGEKIQANLATGSIFDAKVTSTVLTVKHLLGPIAAHEVPLVRCIGLNYRDHAREANMPIPAEPVLFIKPRTAINGPFPAKINVPKISQDGTADYEAELTVIMGKDGKDIPVEEALDYVLGYTCGNDVSARAQQFKNSQWCFSKGLDGSAPLGPVLVSPAAVGDVKNLSIQAIHNSSVVQDSNTREMIFDIATLVSFLSSGTTLEKGTVIMTGTGPGIGCMRDPKVVLNHGDDMRVAIENIGTLINKVHYE
ncbi:Fumarylacetoacetate hydrolase-containing protein [Venustampulla echinocandica]|uniref:Fumarylacetoacetate hydrolase-containing protein n=1 Tax=Venustampulla echinocandica TaxID=2656787 RepID=A0A370TSU7_9HELO|nr:Fumarylacetoacetate hydrolase-containing protein [Venustampulla echinocandica]RDL38599.1 Fumarylacetoacetate hydrolase-containing protein [Venustampulla echinocandica]